MKSRHKRFALLLTGLVVLSSASALVIRALDSNLSYFYSPMEVRDGKAPIDQVFRLGGMVEVGSLKRGSEDLSVFFVVSDGAASQQVRYNGILPDLFGEGQGMIAQGRMDADGVFVAHEVLAKHDETYMPPEVAKALEAGHQASQNSQPATGAKY
jgi:cytochrome c-type biogenesis protein CcmE